MREKIIENLRARFGAYADLIEQSNDEALGMKFDVPRHKSLLEHLWCVVGARESYAKALRAGQWQGFSCSMTNYSQNDFRTSLKASAKSVSDAIEAIEEWTHDHDEFLAALAEHEVMHEGGIIRHVYGTEGTLPSSWKWA